MLALDRFSFGVGDRFAHQAKAQLRAFQMLLERGVRVVPVWNKSNREHTFIGSEPASVQAAAAAAVADMKWSLPWHVDADHIRLETVDRFLPSSDFFTIDVADSIGKPAPAADVDSFVNRHPETHWNSFVPGAQRTCYGHSQRCNRDRQQVFAGRSGARGAIYRHIAAAKGEDRMIAEVSMDENDAPQTPPQLLVILAALADEKIRLQTIAPKFTGRFNKESTMSQPGSIRKGV